MRRSATKPGSTATRARPGSSAATTSGSARAALKQTLRNDHRVGLSGEVYAGPLHCQPIFADLPAGPLPVSVDICARHICLPIHNDMTDSEADPVVDSLRQALKPATRP